MKSETSPRVKVVIGVLIGLIIIGIFYFAWHKNEAKITKPTVPVVETPVPNYPCLEKGKCA